MPEKIVVAGGAGFIGSHLCEFLVSKGEQVICIDNFITGAKSNVSGLLKNKNFTLIKKDISEKFPLPGKIKQIYNLASPASPVDYREKPLETLRAGSLGNMNLLELAREKKAAYLFASTSEIYGNPAEHPQKESYWGNVNPIGPRSCYDEAKRFGEALCTSFRTVHKIDVKIARIFNTYGPKMRRNDGRVMPNFIVQAISGKPITVYGTGAQTRSFCYVSDMVDGLYLLMNSKEHGPVNIGNPNETTIKELANMIIRQTGSRSSLEFLGLPADDPERRLPDIALAQQRLGWKPYVNLERGIKLTVEFFRKQAD